ncbi:MAG: hypothetical protein K2Q23_04945 [Bryobacteraceae bacterium]|nr:hypothetical protein [Bryobacteraceae bacterium]
MTKLERVYEVTKPLDEATQEEIAKLTSIVGIQKVRVHSDLKSVTVGWDAARLSEGAMESILARHGLAVQAKR